MKRMLYCHDVCSLPETKEYNSYYNRHPERKEADDHSRLAPGLLSEQARYFHPGTFAAAKANFEIIEYPELGTYRKTCNRKMQVESRKS